MVVLKDIEFFSTCEHHFLPFFGHCHVAYIPGEYVFGISKLARLVECYAHRLQIQERLTQQIADALDSNGAVGVGVVLEAQHLCMMARGIKKQHSIMKTSALRGALKDKPEARAEFLKLIGGD
jgi:GTP cyclohydrolase I